MTTRTRRRPTEAMIDTKGHVWFDVWRAKANEGRWMASLRGFDIEGRSGEGSTPLKAIQDLLNGHLEYLEGKHGTEI